MARRWPGASPRRPARRPGAPRWRYHGRYRRCRRVPVQRAAQQDAARLPAPGRSGDRQCPRRRRRGRRRPASPRRRSRWRGCASWSRGCRARRRPARRYPTRCAAGRARAIHGDTAVAAAQQADRAAGSTDTSAPAPISMSAPSSMRCERSVRSAPARCVSAPLSGFSWYTGASSAGAGAGPWPAARLVSVHRHRHVQRRALGHAQAVTALMSYFAKPARSSDGSSSRAGAARAGRMGRPVGQRIGPADHHLPIRLQRQRAAAGHAIALSCPASASARGAFHFRRAARSVTSPPLPARVSPLVQHRAARGRIDQRARRHRDAMRRVQRHAAVEPAQPRRGHALACRSTQRPLTSSAAPSRSIDGRRLPAGQRARLDARVRRHEGVAQRDGPARVVMPACASIRPPSAPLPAVGQRHHLGHRQRAAGRQVQRPGPCRTAARCPATRCRRARPPARRPPPSPR